LGGHTVVREPEISSGQKVKHMLEICCQERLDEALAVSKERGLNLQEKLDYLSKWGDEENSGRTRCTLYSDSSPLSFLFYWERRTEEGVYTPCMNGGLIFHGSHDGGGDGGAPTFCVSLAPVDGWSVHT